jgi:hypothetical protein
MREAPKQTSPIEFGEPADSDGGSSSSPKKKRGPDKKTRRRFSTTIQFTPKMVAEIEELRNERGVDPAFVRTAIYKHFVGQTEGRILGIYEDEVGERTPAAGSA